MSQLRYDHNKMVALVTTYLFVIQKVTLLNGVFTCSASYIKHGGRGLFLKIGLKYTVCRVKWGN